MNLDPAVRRESAFAAIASLIGTVAVQLIFVAVGLWDLSVLWGGLIGLAVSTLNFFLMSLTMQKAIETGDQSRATGIIRLSYLWRTLFMLGVLVLSLVVDAIHWIPVVASFFYIRIAITARQLLAKKKDPEPASPPAPAVQDEDEGEEETDELEKLVEHFGRRAKVDYTNASSDRKSDKPNADSGNAGDPGKGE